ncbi:MAG: hypothetical protein OEZ57_07035 [Nitrospirota bacterium]|nr:hypothetical protein [Nitrospirota bacterium]MDH5588386.1 hypothetical protein [Nitrospirota bacterium]MDH5774652.1 hypothetical protein [Nitrospirota bacterium]
MRSWIILTIVGNLLLLGCAEVRYVKAGATQEDFETDKVDCHNQILMSPSGVALTRSTMGRPGVGQGIATQSANQQAHRDVERCLEEKGWARETESK